MNKKLLICISILFVSCAALAQRAQSFESATDAVNNMGVGWNLGNTLDANNATQTWTTTAQHETCWGQPVTKPELMKMMKEAGFGAIRVPVTWYQEMDADGKVNEAWMNRVKEVVDYVIDNGMYCILNVHHDTGADGGSFKSWIKASSTSYTSNEKKYKYLWKQIAETFKDYDQHLLFEAYNEMLDEKSTWNEPVDKTDGYQAINDYAKSFVSTVRATGGNNLNRNLVINTYAASNSANAMQQLELPEDKGHIIFQIHSYPDWKSEGNAKSRISNLINTIKKNLQNRAPVIIGEYATLTTEVSPEIDYYDTDRELALYAMDYFIKKTKAAGIGTFYWMGLSDGLYRSEPSFNQPDLAETIIKAYYGSTDGYKFPTHDYTKETVIFEGEKVLEWGTGVTVQSSILESIGSEVEVKITYQLDYTDYADIQFMYNKGGWTKFTDGLSIDGKAISGADLDPSSFYDISSGDTKTSTLTFNAAAYELVTKNDLVIQGHGVIVTKVTVGLPTTVIPGDANGDGLVNVTDIVATVNYIMEKPVDSFNKEAADLNGDGEINVTDIVMMVSIIMDGGN